MAGIYLHIPFCSKACHYCDFHFSTVLKNMDVMVDALCKEMELRSAFFQGQPAETLYFGGGTPSVLALSQWEKIFTTIHKYFQADKVKECTVEFNPDDVTTEKLLFLKQLGVNRISLGIQTFDDAALQWMNRNHTAYQSEKALSMLLEADYSYLSVDLIYGLPFYERKILENDLERLCRYPIQHISAYCLTIEDRTVFGNHTKNGKMPKIPEDFQAQQMQHVILGLEALGFEQYEISNFCKNGQYALHNSSYWQGKPYLGIGPSAHSYDGAARYMNVSNNSLYVKNIFEGRLQAEVESLTPQAIFNEYLLTHLRTKWGITLDKLRTMAPDMVVDTVLTKVNQLVQAGKMMAEGDALKLTPNGRLVADTLISDLFWI